MEASPHTGFAEVVSEDVPIMRCGEGESRNAGVAVGTQEVILNANHAGVADTIDDDRAACRRTVVAPTTAWLTDILNSEE